MKNSEIIENLYLREQDDEMREQEQSKITVRMPTKDACLFSAIAARFNTTRFNLLEDVLTQASLEMYFALEPKDRKEISKNADEALTKAMLDKGFTCEAKNIVGELVNEWSDWRCYDLLIEKRELEEKSK
jgi:hypothetical protein